MAQYLSGLDRLVWLTDGRRRAATVAHGIAAAVPPAEDLMTGPAQYLIGGVAQQFGRRPVPGDDAELTVDCEHCIAGPAEHVEQVRENATNSRLDGSHAGHRRDRM